MKLVPGASSSFLSNKLLRQAKKNAARQPDSFIRNIDELLAGCSHFAFGNVKTSSGRMKDVPWYHELSIHFRASCC